MNSILKAVKNGALYPRAVIDILHRIIYNGETWEDCATSPKEVETVFCQAWLVYNSSGAKGSQSEFETWVLTDFKTHIKRAIEQNRHNMKTVCRVKSRQPTVVEFKKAA